MDTSSAAESQQPPSFKVSSRPFLMVCAVALALRLILFFYNLQYAPIKYYADSDAYNYENIAVNISSHGTFSNELQPPFSPDISRTPVYPYFLAIFYRAEGDWQSEAILLQVLIGAMVAGLTFLLVRALQFTKREATIAALLVAVDPLSILYANLLMTETIFTFLLIAGTLSLVLFFRTERMQWLALSALMFGLSALTRPIGEYLPLALVILFVVSSKNKRRWVPLRNWALFAILSLGIAFIWVYRNYSAAGVWTLSDKDSYNLVYYRATAVLQRTENLSRDQATAEVQALLDSYGAVSPAEMNRAEYQVALDVFRKYPVATILVHAEGAVRFIVNPGMDDICAQLSRANEIVGCTAAQITSNPGIIEKVRMKFGNLDYVQLAFALWSLLFLVVVYVFAGVGIFALIRERKWFVLLSVSMVILYLLLLSAGGETTSRFRIPTIPYWAIFAGVGYGKMMNFIRLHTGTSAGRPTSST